MRKVVITLLLMSAALFITAVSSVTYAGPPLPSTPFEPDTNAPPEKPPQKPPSNHCNPNRPGFAECCRLKPSAPQCEHLPF